MSTAIPSEGDPLRRNGMLMPSSRTLATLLTNAFPGFCTLPVVAWLWLVDVAFDAKDSPRPPPPDRV